MATLDLLILRHGPTQWNIDKRLQGHTDISVDPASLQRQWPRMLPKPWHNRLWFSSPLLRARQTAEYLGLQFTVESALIEMHWGDWEGKRLSELREESPQELQRLENQGLYMRPPGGESPLEVQQRVSLWVEQRAHSKSQSQQLGVICHKGVIRALLAAATDWDMKGKAPVRLDYHCAQKFSWCEGRWSLVEHNLSW